MPTQNSPKNQFKKAYRKIRPIVISVAIFSVFTNLLMLTGPLYMLQIYDRVLSSQSMETLIGLTLIICFLYSMMGLLDFVRSRSMSRAGAVLQAMLDKLVHQASFADVEQSESNLSKTAV